MEIGPVLTTRSDWVMMCRNSLQRPFLKIPGIHPVGRELFAFHEAFVEAGGAGGLVAVEDIAVAEHAGVGLFLQLR